MTGYEFSFDNIAPEFDDHVREQLPFYDLMIESIGSLIDLGISEQKRHDRKKKKWEVNDIGCATGNLFGYLTKQPYFDDILYLGTEPCVSMGRIARGRYRKYKNFELSDAFLTKSDFIVLNLTWMFMAQRSRYHLDSLQSRVKSGGYIILVDKFYSKDSHERLRNQKMLWDYKAKTQSMDAILRKEVSLQAFQLPEKRKFFTKAGFEEFFRYGDFSGFIWRNDN
jgi:tRNA (cmo5U34)-methyltransferase